MAYNVINELTFEGKKEDIRELMNSVKMTDRHNPDDYFYRGVGTIDFRKIIPQPASIYQGNLGCEEERKYGNRTWEAWNEKYWGTRGNAWNCYKPQRGKIVFNTSNGSALKIVAALSWMFNKVKITYRWAGEEIGEDCGEVIFSSGRLIDGLNFDFIPQKEAKAFAEKLWYSHNAA